MGALRAMWSRCGWGPVSPEEAGSSTEVGGALSTRHAAPPAPPTHLVAAHENTGDVDGKDWRGAARRRLILWLELIIYFSRLIMFCLFNELVELLFI